MASPVLIGGGSVTAVLRYLKAGYRIELIERYALHAPVVGLLACAFEGIFAFLKRIAEIEERIAVFITVDIVKYGREYMRFEFKRYLLIRRRRSILRGQTCDTYIFKVADLGGSLRGDNNNRVSNTRCFDTGTT